MAFFYENCSNLLWEKNVIIIEKNIYTSEAEGENFQKFWDHYVEQFIRTVKGQTVFETEHSFYLLKWRFLHQQLKVSINKNTWDVKTCKNKLEKIPCTVFTMKSFLKSHDPPAFSRNICETFKLQLEIISDFRKDSLHSIYDEVLSLTDPTKLQKPTVLGQRGPASTQWSHPSRLGHCRPSFGHNGYPPFKRTTENQFFFPKWRFWFPAKERTVTTKKMSPLNSCTYRASQQNPDPK